MKRNQRGTKCTGKVVLCLHKDDCVSRFRWSFSCREPCLVVKDSQLCAKQEVSRTSPCGGGFKADGKKFQHGPDPLEVLVIRSLGRYSGKENRRASGTVNDVT